METLCSSWWIQSSNSSSTTWTKEENKQFESALALFDEKTPNRWLMVAQMIPGKSENDVLNQYMRLVVDVSNIEAGLVPIPGYLASSFTLELADHSGFEPHVVYRKRGRSGCDQERKKGVPWTEDEHRRFLLGLAKHGKGDWRNISRNFVISKTPTQVASHAQKYYQRQLSGGKDKRRPSIHDITTVSLSTDENCPTQNNISSTETAPSNEKIALDCWNHSMINGGANLMVFDSFCPVNSIINIGASSPGYQPPRFRGC